jgi:hypothetical protein
MLPSLLKGLGAFHTAVAVVGAVGLFVFWARTRFWLPFYVHVLALVGLVVSVWSISISLPDSPVGRARPIAKILFALLLPAIVYFFFVFHGGQRVAFKRRFGNPAKCPSCGADVVARLGVHGTEPQISSKEAARCDSCGQALM